MGAALIGFIGVVAGAIITAWFDRRAEKDRRRAEARVASQLIAGEIENAVLEIDSALEAGHWWSGKLPTKQWHDNGAALAAVVNPQLTAGLADVYMQFEAWERARLESPSALSSSIRDELQENKKLFEFLAKQTKGAVSWKPANRIVQRVAAVARPAAVTLMALAALLATFALVYAVFVPREEITDGSIAAALERQLPGEGEIASCRHDADRWLCNVSYPNRPPGACKVKRSNLQPVSLLVRRSTDAGQPCPRAAAANLPTSFEVATGDDQPVATVRSDQIARNKRTERLETTARELGMDKKSIAEGVVDWIKGR